MNFHIVYFLCSKGKGRENPFVNGETAFIVVLFDLKIDDI